MIGQIVLRRWIFLLSIFNAATTYLGLSLGCRFSVKKFSWPGNSGIIGKFLLANLLDANETLALYCKITGMSRDRWVFKRDWQVLVDRVNWVKGGVRDVQNSNHHFDLIVHAAKDMVLQLRCINLFPAQPPGLPRAFELTATALLKNNPNNTNLFKIYSVLCCHSVLTCLNRKPLSALVWIAFCVNIQGLTANI